MKSALCSSTLLWAIRAVEKLRKKLYHGVFIAEVISALPLFQPPPPSPVGDQAQGFPRKELAISQVLPVSPQPGCPVGPCFGDSHAWDTAPSVERSVKAGTVQAPRSAPLSHQNTFSPRAIGEN